MEGGIEMDEFGAAKDADIGGDEYDEDDTSFSEPPDVPTTDPWSNTVDDASGHITDLRKQMRYQKNEAYKRQLIHTLYASIKDQYGIAPKTIDYNNFALDKDGNLILKAGKTRVILNSAYNKNKFLSLRTIVDKLGRGAQQSSEQNSI